LIKGVIIKTYAVNVEHAAPKSVPFAKNVIFLYAKNYGGGQKLLQRFP
jgi:hypothetical protein